MLLVSAARSRSKNFPVFSDMNGISFFIDVFLLKAQTEVWIQPKFADLG